MRLSFVGWLVCCLTIRTVIVSWLTFFILLSCCCCFLSVVITLKLLLLHRYNDNPHGVFGILSDNQQVVVDPVESRSLALNFSRYSGAFGTVVLTYSVAYSEVCPYVILFVFLLHAHLLF